MIRKIYKHYLICFIMIFPLLFIFFTVSDGFIRTLSHASRPCTMTPVRMYSDTDVKRIINNPNALDRLPYSQLIDKIKNKEISKIFLSNRRDEVIAENKLETEDVYSDFFITDIVPDITGELVDLSLQNKVEPVFKMKADPPNPIQVLATDSYLFINNTIFPFIMLSLFFSIIRGIFFMSRNGAANGGSPFGQGMPGSLNINLKKDKEEMKKSNITLQSFAGSPEIFQECTEIVSYLKNATIYEAAGATIPRGILLEGPPGTGKTLLAKAIASDTDANFLSITASEFVEVFVGVGAAKVRNLFETARKNAPCIIFIDEFDSIGRQRGVGLNMANDEREQTLNQLLAEMDGFANNDGILIIAATNRKDILDAALLRPGRFDRIVKVSLPDKNSRRDILAVHAKNKQFSENVNLDFVAELTTGFSGAQLKNLLNEAAIFTARRGETVIKNQDVLDALEKLVVGLIRKVDTRSQEARRRVAVHEIGHAFLCAQFGNYFDLKKVTIQSTYNGAGGYTLFNERQNISEAGLYTKDFYKKQLIVAMGGKAAECLYYGNEFISVGAVQDLKQANSLAERMIGNYGMGKELDAFYNRNADPALARNGDTYSDKIKEKFDRESIGLVDEALHRAQKMLSENREYLDVLVEKLLEKNTLLGTEFSEILDDCTTTCELE